jgi:hypothetical protein
VDSYSANCLPSESFETLITFCVNVVSCVIICEYRMSVQVRLRRCFIHNAVIMLIGIEFIRQSNFALRTNAL